MYSFFFNENSINGKSSRDDIINMMNELTSQISVVNIDSTHSTEPNSLTFLGFTIQSQKRKTELRCRMIYISDIRIRMRRSLIYNSQFQLIFKEQILPV